jgi:endonuclease YncB( thermonuclease family)
MKKIIYFFIFTFFFSIISYADDKKIQVIDGDTIHVGNVKYRLFGIDAPEIKQVCKKNNKKIECGVIAKDTYLKLKLEIRFQNVL